MEDPPIITPAVVPGQESGPGSSQAVVPGTEVPGQAQVTTSPGVVEPGQPSSHAATPSQSDIETARQIKSLFKEIRSLKQSLRETFERSPSAPAPSAPQTAPTVDDFLRDPIGLLNKLMDERDERIKGEIPKTLDERDRESRYVQSRQEALKLIRTNEAVRHDPEGEEKVKDILEDETFGLDEIAKVFPLESAKIALEIYSARFGKSARTGIPTKGQLASTATAVTSAAGKPSLDQEALELQKQALADPMLLYDPEFKKKVDALKMKRASQLQTA